MRRGDTGTRGRGDFDNNVIESDKVPASPRPRVGGSTIDWSSIKRILVVRLRSIGDTVLSTPSLIALRRFLPDVQIDILLEGWVAPLLDEFDAVDNVIRVDGGSAARLKIAWQIRRNRYDAVFNLHGGTTATFFTRASGAAHRVGYASYQYPFLYNHLLSSSSDFWGRKYTHSAEQQLALLGFVGVPVDDRPKSRLTVSQAAVDSLEAKMSSKQQSQISNLKSEVDLESTRQPQVSDVNFDEAKLSLSRQSQISNLKSEVALLHPAAAFATKQWSAEGFARVAEYLSSRGMWVIAVATKNEREVLEKLKSMSNAPIIAFDDLTLPEITALASRSAIFVGNDSGIAHIAAAVNTPTVVVFGSSNRHHWEPWTDAPNEIVYEEFACQPCAGYECKEFGEPRCILSVKTESVVKAVERVLKKAEQKAPPVLSE